MWYSEGITAIHVEQITTIQSLNFNNLDTTHLSIATSFTEEILGRGFLFNYLEKYTGKFSLYLSPFIFIFCFVFTSALTEISGQALFFNLLLNFLLSFMTSILFHLRKNILSSIAFHMVFYCGLKSFWYITKTFLQSIL